MGCGASSVGVADDDEMGIIVVGMEGSGKSSFMRSMGVGKVTRVRTVGKKIGDDGTMYDDDDEPSAGQKNNSNPSNIPGDLAAHASSYATQKPGSNSPRQQPEGNPPITLEFAKMRSLKIYSWDLQANIGANVKEMRSWCSYSQNAKALLFTVDCSPQAKDKLVTAGKLLRWLLEEVEDFKSNDVFLIVLCTKQDVEDAIGPDEVNEKLKVDELCGGGEQSGGRLYRLMPIASGGKGVFDVVNYMTRTVVSHRNR